MENATNASMPMAILAGTVTGTVFLRTPSSSFRPIIAATATTGPGVRTATIIAAMAITAPGISNPITIVATATRVPGLTATLVGMLPGK